MHHLLRRKIDFIYTIILCFVPLQAWHSYEEINQEDHDDRPYPFWDQLGYNSSHFNFTHHPQFLQHDTIMDVESINSAGINFGMAGKSYV